MAQTTILAAGQTAASSSTFTVDAGSSATVSMQAPSGSIPGSAILPVLLKQGSGWRAVGSLSRDVWNHVVSGPGEFRVDRSDIAHLGVDVAVLLDA